MNCKPGDLAYITGLPAAAESANGRFVTLVERYDFHGEPAWRFQRPVEFVVSHACMCCGVALKGGEIAVMTGLQDKYLRPVRDPGDDAQDEMLRPLPVRQNEPAPA
jgi:hypothetical protein